MRAALPCVALASLAACAAAVAAAPATAHAAIAFAPCEPAGYECGALPVPLDRGGANGPAETVTLQAKRVRAASNPTATAVVALAGGPGQAALPLTTDFAEVMAPALAARDLLVFDQRGTGRSGRLRCCGARVGLVLAGERGPRCAQQLGPRRAFYTTADSVADLEDLRREAGYERLVLLGVSYGTKVALDYAAAHPDRVESLVLDSIVPPEGWDALLRPTLEAVPRVLRALCDGGACRGITGDPVRDLRALVRRVDRRSVSGPLPNPSGRRVRVRITPLALFDVLIAGDENPTLRADLPGAVRSALAGDLRPLVRLRARAAGVSGIAARAGCSAPAATRRATRCTRPRCARSRASRGAARPAPSGARDRRWPRRGGSGGPGSARSPATSRCSAAPSARAWAGRTPRRRPLPRARCPRCRRSLLDGADDLRTPLESARAVAGRIPGAAVVAVPFTGHSTLGSDPGTCARGAVAAFFAGQPQPACTTERLLQPSPVAPTRLGRVPGRTRTARTLEALRATVRDVARQFTGDAVAAGRAPSPGARVAGLRSGVAVWRASGVRLAARAVRARGGRVGLPAPRRERERRVHHRRRGRGPRARDDRARRARHRAPRRTAREHELRVGCRGGRRDRATASRPRGLAGRAARAPAPLAASRDPADRAAGARRHHGRHGQRPRPRDLALPPPAPRQPGRLAAVGRGGAAPRARGGPPAAGLDRLLGLPLVPRHGARDLRGPDASPRS